MKRIHSFYIFILLLVIEILIAMYSTTPFIRHFLGDVLVIPLLFFFLKLFTTIKNTTLVIVVVLFAFFVELLQLLKFADVLGIHNKILRIIIGTTFSFTDLVAYVLGGIFTVLYFHTRKKTSSN